MSKEKIVIKSIGGVGINEIGSCLVLMFTNYGVLMYDSGTEKFSLNDIEISSEDFDLENAYKEAINAMSFTLNMLAPKKD